MVKRPPKTLSNDNDRLDWLERQIVLNPLPSVWIAFAAGTFLTVFSAFLWGLVL
jgi:hypothetical protein